MVEEDGKRKAKYCGEQDVAKGDKWFVPSSQIKTFDSS
jgi:hypothetical protein